MFMNISKKFLDNALEQAFEQILELLMPSKTNGEVSAAQLVKTATASGTAAAAIGAMTAAATAATAALTALAGGGAGGGAPGGGGIFGALLGAGTSVLGSFLGSGLGSTLGTVDAGAVGVGDSVLNNYFNRATGGPVTRGWGYQINEAGVKSKEVFIPGQSGTVMELAKLAGMLGCQGRGDYNDYTHIDARGASVDAVKELEQVMLRREQRLRAELPTMVDQRVIDSSRRGRLG
jgi:hypothetical protein